MHIDNLISRIRGNRNYRFATITLLAALNVFIATLVWSKLPHIVGGLSLPMTIVTGLCVVIIGLLTFVPYFYFDQVDSIGWFNIDYEAAASLGYALLGAVVLPLLYRDGHIELSAIFVFCGISLFIAALLIIYAPKQSNLNNHQPV